ncbi:helix-turn-helix transcriptional regulator [Oscillospiraceae bacterium PP1C4]
MSADMKLFGQRVVTQRKVFKITQKELAKTIHISQQALYRIEKGLNKNIPYDVLLGLAMKLCCTHDYLYGLSERPGENRDRLRPGIILYPPWTEELKKESADLLIQDAELGELMLKCCNFLNDADMKTLKNVVRIFLNNAKLQKESENP